ncbi:MAG: thiamine-monophosphate kinase, partial [Candidatus Hydrothermarchaeaceae archaeon]
ICVLGGDTKEQESIVITVTALGKVEKKKLLRRSGAREGDLICVTGMMGSAAAGFYCIIKELDIEEEIREKFVRAAMEPAARVEAGILISGHASSCIDISDGLAWSLHEIARASGRGFTVEMDKIPFDRDVERVAGAAGVSVDDIIFFKGGDYELLFTIPEKNYENVRKSLAEAGGVSVIGRIKESGTLIERDGSAVELEGTGYDSFKTRF